jgi:hypothetical protein
MAEETKIKLRFQIDKEPIVSVRQELIRVLEQQRAINDVGSEAFKELDAQAAVLRQTLKDIEAETEKITSPEKYEKLGKQFGELGKSIMSLDFSKAKDQANDLIKTAKKITFKDAIGSVKSLGSTFVTLAKTILTNPMFLIAAVVGAIVGAIALLLDKLGILDKIFKAVGDAIEFVIQKLKDFLDWLGLTTFAAEEAANKQAKAQEKIASSHEKKREKVVDAYDHEIRLAKIAGKDTVEMERQKQFAIIETSKQQVEALTVQIQSMRAAGTLTKEKADEIRKAMAELRKGIHEAKQEIEGINAQEVADNQKKNEEISKQNQANAKALQAQREQNKADRLAALRAIQDAELGLMAEGEEKELALNRLKAQRQLEDTLKNTKLTEGEKNRLRLAIEEQYQIDAKAITQKFRDEEQAIDDEAAKKRQEQRDKDFKAELDASTAKLALDKELRDKKAEMDKLAGSQALDLAENVTASIMANAKEGSKFAKGVAVSQALMSTFRGANAAFTSTAESPLGIANPAAPFIAAAAAVAMGLANVRKIVAVSDQGGGSDSPANVQMPNFGTATTPQSTPQMFVNNNGANAGGEGFKQKVMVVDYHDIKQKANELFSMKQKVTLA